MNHSSKWSLSSCIPWCLYNTFTNTYSGGLCRFRHERFINFLTSVLGDTRREIQFLLYWAKPQSAAYLVVFKISVGRDLQNLTTCPNDRRPNSMPQRSNLNSFQNPQILGTVSSGHNVMHTPASFSVWFFLCQWWLSNLLRASVKLHPMTMHLNS